MREGLYRSRDIVAGCHVVVCTDHLNNVVQATTELRQPTKIAIAPKPNWYFAHAVRTTVPNHSITSVIVLVRVAATVAEPARHRITRARLQRLEEDVALARHRVVDAARNLRAQPAPSSVAPGGRPARGLHPRTRPARPHGSTTARFRARGTGPSRAAGGRLRRAPRDPREAVTRTCAWVYRSRAAARLSFGSG